MNATESAEAQRDRVEQFHRRLAHFRDHYSALIDKATRSDHGYDRIRFEMELHRLLHDHGNISREPLLAYMNKLAEAGALALSREIKP